MTLKALQHVACSRLWSCCGSSLQLPCMIILYFSHAHAHHAMSLAPDEPFLVPHLRSSRINRTCLFHHNILQLTHDQHAESVLGSCTPLHLVGPVDPSRTCRHMPAHSVHMLHAPQACVVVAQTRTCAGTPGCAIKKPGCTAGVGKRSVHLAANRCCFGNTQGRFDKVQNQRKLHASTIHTGRTVLRC